MTKSVSDGSDDGNGDDSIMQGSHFKRIPIDLTQHDSDVSPQRHVG